MRLHKGVFLQLFAAAWPATRFGRWRRWLHAAHEGAHKFLVHGAGKRVYVETLGNQEFPGIVDAVNARWFQFDMLEAGRGQLGAVFVFLKSSSDASDPEQNALPDLGSDLSARDYIGDGEAPTGF
jgi:hypothetical protein